MIRKALLTAIAAVSFLLPAVAVAQGTQPQGQRPLQDHATMRADTLIGMPLKNQQGESLGEVENLMIDVKDGRVAYAVLDLGGWLNLGGKHVVAPLSALRPQPGERHVTLNVDKDKLRTAPSFPRTRWPDTVERPWLADVYNFYNVRPYAAPQGGTAEQIPVARATTIMGMDVENAQGEDLGEIEDLMIDMQDGRIAYAGLAYGGWLGLGENLAAVPWQALKFNSDEGDFTLNVDKEKLRAAPHFAKDKWPQTVDRKWLADVYAYYGARPYWQ
ncbi:MAG TPA: PRC-barrel domain-containing protein [Candidatus Tectomicrobia bacterium]|nr:PRC-barrel domain-containing protein [Candidatus Tectomicrobia bacterium]